MGQKVNPIALRLGIHHGFKSVGYYDKKNYAKTVLQDIRVREMLLTKLKPAGVGDIIIERSVSSIKISIFVVRPGIVIGRGGTGLEELKKQIVKFLKLSIKGKNDPKIELKVEPIKEPNLSAYLVANNVSDQLIRRMPHKRIMKQSIERVMSSGAKGVRIVLSGRIGGAEIGRRERVQAGKVSLSTIRADIDFASVPALTKSGYIGVKVWINR
ncbi:MAG: 30S ribosomal protein S3 [Candidatus Levybacteria bacterium CG_4_10_14_0_2_um_filter_36_16]|nr:MAG: 30S ribosomal protein S3 [Candidatus Levybacteria bacterium CG2_30_37_29]PIR79295.1 MAG: 30S ribosomal protein S3 [Candidatus Levybacteria bacterium CG10_big_fil_rev_8_21_14_0_10_36_30]PIZ97126.1 MAG: 30S ribosomal protein S3 [Candidatus Levybacteria bacterium CG_4_10_14_0_2_um_filter_36_16]PJA90203.1 MAG: 30S ribosomal protein S3 [Candidatus Levybacteria bacterium CG_4_9_14_3_um_filter_36_7]